MHIYIFSNIDDTINHYKERYKNSNKFSTDDNYTLCQTKEYIDLVFILYEGKKTKDYSHKIVKTQHGGNVDETICETYFSNVTKENKLNEIFKVNDKFIYIFEGAPGIGKSIVAKQIAYEWASNKILPKVELLLLLYFRDPELQNVQNFSELMQYCKAYKCEEYFNNKHGKDLMLVFDGYDELSSDTYIYSLFKKLLQREILPCCSIAFTSRPHITAHLHNYCDCKIEILGFSEENRLEFLTKNNVSKEDTDKVKQFLKENLIINSLCYVPFNMANLLLLVVEKDDLPKTQTELTKRSISITISHHIRRSCNHVHIEKRDLEMQVKKVMNLLSSLAYTMIEKEKLVFTETEINNAGFKVLKTDKNAFGLMQVVQFTDAETSTEILYSFIHFSVQEYLAAYYLSQCITFAQSFYLRHNFWDERYFGIWKMYTGITAGKGFALQQFLSKENYIFGGIRYLSRREFPGVSKHITIKKVNCLLLYLMFLEAPDSKVKDSFSNIFKNDMINLSNETLYLQDVSLLSNCITRSYITMNWKLINLHSCRISDEECSKLFQGLNLDDGRQKPVVQYLDLSKNNIAFDIAFEKFLNLNEIHGTSTIINCLNISNNNIMNFKVLNNIIVLHKITDLKFCNNAQLMNNLETLENNVIKKLDLSYNHWPIATSQLILPNLPNLQTLRLIYTNFKDNSTLTLHVHDNMFPSLKELILSHCLLTPESIAKFLRAIPRTVQLLDLSYNEINDQVLKSLQEFFDHNDNLHYLSLASTGLNGAKSLHCVQALVTCTKLEILDISRNVITDDEAKSVIIASQKIPKLKKLIQENYLAMEILRYVKYIATYVHIT